MCRVAYPGMYLQKRRIDRNTRLYKMLSHNSFFSIYIQYNTMKTIFIFLIDSLRPSNWRATIIDFFKMAKHTFAAISCTSDPVLQGTSKYKLNMVTWFAVVTGSLLTVFFLLNILTCLPDIYAYLVSTSWFIIVTNLPVIGIYICGLCFCYVVVFSIILHFWVPQIIFVFSQSIEKFNRCVYYFLVMSLFIVLLGFLIYIYILPLTIFFISIQTTLYGFLYLTCSFLCIKVVYPSVFFFFVRCVSILTASNVDPVFLLYRTMSLSILFYLIFTSVYTLSILDTTLLHLLSSHLVIIDPTFLWMDGTGKPPKDTEFEQHCQWFKGSKQDLATLRSLTFARDLAMASPLPWPTKLKTAAVIELMKEYYAVNHCVKLYK
uniref:Uncharacterized protein n=1 Tax=Tsukubamonas globosa TaxID=875863 RepID=W8VKJ7_9EUKA|nr:hypothetical protein [Tsukubamonas globosa]BAO51991.1 hypothetical protein [Tsukubamonas globosa]